MHSLRSLTLTRTRSGGASEEHAAAGVKSETRARSSTRCASRVSVREMRNGGESATALRQSCNVFAKVLVPPRLRAHLPLPSALCVQTPKAPFAALPSSCNRPAAAVGGLASSLCPARVAPHPLTSPTRSPPHQRVPRTAAAGRRRGGGQRDAGDNWCAERQDGPDARDATITRSRVQRPHQSPTVRHLRLARPASPAPQKKKVRLRAGVEPACATSALSLRHSKWPGSRYMYIWTDAGESGLRARGCARHAAATAATADLFREVCSASSSLPEALELLQANARAARAMGRQWPLWRRTHPERRAIRPRTMVTPHPWMTQVSHRPIPLCREHMRVH